MALQVLEATFAKAMPSDGIKIHNVMRRRLAVQAYGFGEIGLGNLISATRV